MFSGVVVWHDLRNLAWGLALGDSCFLRVATTTKLPSQPAMCPSRCQSSNWIPFRSELSMTTAVSWMSRFVYGTWCRHRRCWWWLVVFDALTVDLCD